MIPQTLVVGRGLKVYNGCYFLRRPPMAELHAEPRELGKQNYRDWNIIEPGWRQKWQARCQSDFYPYGEESISIETLKLQMAGAVGNYAGEAGSD